MTSIQAPIAEVAFDLSYTPNKMGVRLYAPRAGCRLGRLGLHVRDR
jgi:hypothetical protein